ncbi:MAG: cell division topological specificity factor MinE, partial [Chloroflexota bacterium]
RLFGKSDQNDKSGKLAKDRLQFVLVQDRINLPADKMQRMQKEIIEVISKYVAVDMEKVDFALSNRDRSGLLIAEIPFKHAVDSDEDARDEDLAPEVKVTLAEEVTTEAVAGKSDNLPAPSAGADEKPDKSSDPTASAESSDDPPSTDGDGDSDTD